MPRISNPFRAPLHNYPAGYNAGGYNNPQMAETANNISGFLLGGETPLKQAERQAKDALYASTTRYHDAQAGNLNAKTDELRRGATMQSDDQLFNTALYDHGLDPKLPNDQIQAQLDANPDLKASVLRRLGAYRGLQSGMGSTNSQQFESGQSVARDRRISDMIIAGEADPTKVAQAEYATKGGVPFSGGKEQSTNNLTGAQVINPIGQSDIALNGAKVTTEGAHAGLYNAQAGHARAQTDKTRSDMNREKMVVTPVVDAQGNQVTDSNGVAKFIYQPATAGAPAPAPAGYLRPNPGDRAADRVKEMQAITAETDRQLGQVYHNGQWSGGRSDFKADPAVTDAIITEARAIQDSTGENRPDVLVQSAIKKLGSRIQRNSPMVGQNTITLGQIATGQGAPVASPAPGQTVAGPSLPPAAASRLREGVVTTFGNGQQWTLQNGQPVQVQ